MRYDDHPILLSLGIVLATMVIGVCCWITKSYCEARAFTRMTGKPATTWDAMFLELRVQEPAKD